MNKINPSKWIGLALLALALTGCNGAASPTPTAVPPIPTTEVSTLPPVDGPVALPDLLYNSYHGLEGGLYPERSNTMPDAHALEGIARAEAIQPLDETGSPSAQGKIVVLSIGHNNTGSIFCGPGPLCSSGTFVDLATRSIGLNPDLVFVNGASLAGNADAWTKTNSQKYRMIRENLLRGARVTAEQVQVVWLDLANAVDSSVPTLNDSNADAYNLLAKLSEIVRALKEQYPNLQQVFLSSRMYGGYGTGEEKHEPHAYETGFAVKWLIGEQILQANGGTSPLTSLTGDLKYGDAVPWLAWGPYLWADGTNARSDGFDWKPEDFDGSGLNLSPIGVAKASRALLNFFWSSPFTYPWLLTSGGAAQAPDLEESTATAVAEITARPGATPTEQASAATSTPNAPTGACVPHVPEYPGSTAMQPIPLIDMAGDPSANYYGFQGGLYPGGTNEVPTAHAEEGYERALNVQPLDANGAADPNGKIVMLSVGMSNTSQEFCGNKEGCFASTFGGQANADPAVDTDHIVFVNGARSGQSAENWLALDSRNYTDIGVKLQEAGMSELQVQVIWLKVVNGQARSRPSLPDENADAYLLLSRLGIIVRNLYTLYPNLQQVFIASRAYGGYTDDANSPEPYAYESGFAVKWLVEAQIHQMETGEVDACTLDVNYDTAAPWVAWGDYFWANGTIPRSDGLIWVGDNFNADGIHMSSSGIKKVGALLLDFFKNSPLTACWFLRDGICSAP